MVLQVFSIYDKKTVLYGRPFYAHNSGHAMRLIKDEMAGPNNMLANHPDDFTLVKIGEYDDNTSELKPMSVSVVCEVKDLIEIKE